MKKISIIRTIVKNFFPFYQILQNDKTVHLSFNNNKHERAIKKLQQEFAANLIFQERQISLAELRDMLSLTEKFSDFSRSFFISNGTRFQQLVWEQLCHIPFGETVTYGNIAGKLGNKSLARAVGQACGANPIALLIPCHRVVGHSGLGGYTGGLEIKKYLLELEAGQNESGMIRSE